MAVASAERVSVLGTDGQLVTVQLREAPEFQRPMSPLTSRQVYTAAHVVPRVWGDNVPGASADIDWETALGYRRHLYSWGLGVAEAMDTAQRNMGLDTAATRELITRSAHEAGRLGGSIVAGVNTDHLHSDTASLNEVIDAYLEQLHFTEQAGAGVVLMATRHLARAAYGPDGYAEAYRRVIEEATAPVILHWLGEAFDPALAGYFGDEDAGDRVAGIKMSLLDADAEIRVRNRLPHTARMFTGDDYNYVSLIEGDGASHSDALLGRSPRSGLARPLLFRPSMPTTSRDTGMFWGRPRRFPATSLRHPPATTRQASPLCHGSTATKIPSVWSAG